MFWNFGLVLFVLEVYLMVFVCERVMFVWFMNIYDV